MLDDNEMVYSQHHCCPDALSEIRMMKAVSSEVEEIACLSSLQNVTNKENIKDLKGNERE